jgi:phosphatidate cytidylyltransferase
VANVLGSLVAAVIAAFTFIHKIQWTHAVVLGLALSVVGQVGDLCESVLKRGANVKDSSGLLPGHGGVLDRLDSILFNAPLVYYYHLLFLQ